MGAGIALPIIIEGIAPIIIAGMYVNHRQRRRRRRAPAEPISLDISGVPNSDLWGFGYELCRIPIPYGGLNRISIDLNLELDSDAPRIVAISINLNSEPLSSMTATLAASSQLPGVGQIAGTRELPPTTTGDLITIRTHARMPRPTNRECAIDDSRLSVHGSICLH